MKIHQLRESLFSSVVLVGTGLVKNIEHTRHCSIFNFTVNRLAALAAYLLQLKKPLLNLKPEEIKMMLA